MNIQTTLAERKTTHGEFVANAYITMVMKNLLRRGTSYNQLSADQQLALDMIAHKMGRAVNGDPDYIDNWTDIIGYATLVEDRMKETAAKKEEVALNENPDAVS